MRSGKVKLSKNLTEKLIIAFGLIIILATVFVRFVCSNNEFNNAVTVFEVILIAALVIYILIILVRELKQKKMAVYDDTELSYVVEGMNLLFDKFILVNLDSNTYKYIANTYPEKNLISAEGEYSEFIKYFTSMLVDNDEALKLSEEIQPNNIKKKLASSDSISFEYFIDCDKNQWEKLNVICIKKDDGVPRQLLMAFQSILEFKKDVALKEEFQMAIKAKNEFLSQMSHDIRTLMNAIMGMTTIAEMNLDDTDRVADCLNKISVSCKHLLRTINQVLDISKIESGKLTLTIEEFNFAETIENLMNVVYPQIEKKNLNFKTDISNIKHELVMGDAQRLHQVFANILGNAIKFTPDGGEISMKISESPSKKLGEGCYEIIISDNGIGMEKEFIERIFEPFAKANDLGVDRSEGTGLSMAIAKNIIEMMDGNIQVNSELGVGSEFIVTIYLKLCDEADENLDKLSDLSILVVDDDSDNCRNVSEVLSRMGMIPDWITDGHSVIDKLLDAKKKDKSYMAVILDRKINDMDGIEIAKDIREKIDKNVPYIIMMSYDCASVEQEARNIGVNEFVSKPVFKSKLVEVMNNLVEQKEKLASKRVILEKVYQGRRVLLVEDNELNAEIAEEILKMAGVIVDIASDGVEAVQIFTDSEENYYDFILMDIQMPNMNGYDATKTIRSLDRSDSKSVPIIAMSANAFNEDIRKAKMSGMNAHIAKPIEISELTNTIDDWIK